MKIVIKIVKYCHNDIRYNFRSEKSPLQMIDKENPLITNEIKWPDNKKIWTFLIE